MGSHRGWNGEDIEEYGHLWQALAEHVCPVSGNPHRSYHQDLAALSDDDLALELDRARFRCCLERDRADLRWLRERMARIRGEQAHRAPASKRTAARRQVEEEEVALHDLGAVIHERLAELTAKWSLASSPEEGTENDRSWLSDRWAMVPDLDDRLDGDAVAPDQHETNGRGEGA
jgi:hypothetical protein